MSQFIHRRESLVPGQFPSAGRSQQSGLGCQRLVLLDVVLLEAQGDPLGHLQVLLQAQLRAAGLRGQRALVTVIPPEQNQKNLPRART